MLTVLVPVDFTRRSQTAVDYVCETYTPNEFRLILLHAYNSLRTGDFLVSVDDIIEHSLKQRMEGERDRIVQKFSLKPENIELVQKEGSIIKVLEKAINSFPVDLIALGFKMGFSWNDSTYEGKTVNIVRTLPLPVLIVPDRDDIRRPNRIVFATRLMGIKLQRDVSPLLDILKQNGGHLDIINISDDSQDIAEIPGKLMQTINGYFEGIEFSMHALESDEPHHAIREYSESHKIDLISILYHQHNLLDRLLNDNVSDKMMSHLNKPLLALKHLG